MAHRSRSHFAPRPRLSIPLALAVPLILVLPLSLPGASFAQGDDSVRVPQTGKTVRGAFLRYWMAGGGTFRYGLPISDEVRERSDLDGRTYTVQYFERAVFEAHSDYIEPYNVLLVQLGRLLYHQKYPNGATGQMPNNAPGSLAFAQTGKRIGCQFLEYWQQFGGLMRFGYPITDELVERQGGVPVRVQYFERAVLMWDNEAVTTFDMGRGYVTTPPMGTERLAARYSAQATALPTLAPTSTPFQLDACGPTRPGPSFSDQYPDPPERASVGTGLVVTGTVRSSGGCAPISRARVVYWLAGPDGQYNPEHEGKVFTRPDGTYRIQTNFPGFYGAGGPHIHFYMDAPGHQGTELEIFVACGQTTGRFDVVLAPE
jgi:hypothetical protein